MQYYVYFSLPIYSLTAFDFNRDHGSLFLYIILFVARYLHRQPLVSFSQTVIQLDYPAITETIIVSG